MSSPQAHQAGTSARVDPVREMPGPHTGLVHLSEGEATAGVDAFVKKHRSTVAATLREAGRSSVAHGVEKLPEGAEQVRDASLADLKVLIEAHALAEAALCVSYIRSGNYLAAVRSADAALIVFGLPLGASLRAAIDSVLRLAGEAHEKDLSSSLKSVEIVGDAPPIAHTVHVPGAVEEDLSLKDFHQNFFKHDVPVVLKDAAERWPAVTFWRKPSFLDRIAGFRTVPVEISKPWSVGPPREEFTSIQRVLESMQEDSPNKEIMYLAQHPIFDYIPLLKDHIVEPRHIRACNPAGPSLINIWMGSARSGTRLHFDTADNLLVQVVGWKRAVLFPPSVSGQLHVAEGDNFSPVDVDDWNPTLHPNFRNAQGYKFLLGPGDVLYIPAGWWHWVRAVTPSISVNYWF